MRPSASSATEGDELPATAVVLMAMGEPTALNSKVPSTLP